jgi:hypothetical protein
VGGAVDLVRTVPAVVVHIAAPLHRQAPPVGALELVVVALAPVAAVLLVRPVSAVSVEVALPARRYALSIAKTEEIEMINSFLKIWTNAKRLQFRNQYL